MSISRESVVLKGFLLTRQRHRITKQVYSDSSKPPYLSPVDPRSKGLAVHIEVFS